MTRRAAKPSSRGGGQFGGAGFGVHGTSGSSRPGQTRAECTWEVGAEEHPALHGLWLATLMGQGTLETSGVSAEPREAW